MNDLDLLGQYLQQGSQTAFTAVVTRYMDLVYSAALRQVHSPDFAREVTQTVFLELSVNAGKLRPDTHVASWLYVVTRRTAIDAIRRETSRQRREQAALEVAAMKSSSSLWAELEPWLDEAISALDPADRKAILLRFFENKSLDEIGRALGASEDAAQKRVSRAVERLRLLLSKRGVAVTAAGIASEVSLHAVQSAPAGLAGTVSSAIGLPVVPASHVPALPAARSIATTFAQKAYLAAVITVAVGGLLYQMSGLRSQQRQISALQTELTDLQRQALQLRDERDRARARAAALAQARAVVLENAATLDARLDALLARVAKLKQWIDQHPEQQIPELGFLKNKDWLEIAQRYARLDSDADFAQAVGTIRSNAKSHLFFLMRDAMDGYLAQNQGRLPANVSQLAHFLATPVEEAILQRYEMKASGLASEASGAFIVEKAETLIDPEHDSRHELDRDGVSMMLYPAQNVEVDLDETAIPEEVKAAVEAAGEAYQAAHQGEELKDLKQLEPYFQDPKMAASFFQSLASAIQVADPLARQDALKLFRAGHNGGYPATPEELAPYFEDKAAAAKFLASAKDGHWED